MKALHIVRTFAPLGWLLLTGCRGTVPTLYGRPEAGISAVLIGAKFLTPTGEAQYGRAAINLESDSETYRLEVPSGAALLFTLEPGSYRVLPTRGLFGMAQEKLTVSVEGEPYQVPFPSEIMRKEAVQIQLKKVVALGLLEVRVLVERQKGERGRVYVTLDDSAQAKRRVVEDIIQSMMDENTPKARREAAVQWTRQLEEALVQSQRISK